MAALSASPSAEQVPTQAQRSSGNVESQSLSLNDVQAAVSSQLAPVLEAFQALSGRMTSYENNMSRNCAEPPQPSHPSQVRLTLPVPSQGSSRTGPVGGGGGPPGPEDPYWEGDDGAEGDEDEELVADPTPKLERDMVDSCALQHAKLDAIPSNASEFRAQAPRYF